MTNPIQRLVRATDNLLARAYLALFRERSALITFLFHSLFRDQAEIDRNAVDPLERTTVGQVRELIEYYREHGYAFIGPDELLGGLESGRKYALITFDDGYYNNRLVLPILEEHTVPAIFFISTNHIRDNKCFWWDVLYRERIRQGSTERQIYREALSLKYRPTEAIEAYLIEHFGPKCLAPWCDIDRPFTPDELRDFAKHPLVHLGNHTANHAILANYSEDAMRAQVKGAQDYIASLTGKAPTSIAYPNGAHNSHIHEICQELGVPLGFTTQPRKTRLPLEPGSPNLMRIGRFVPHNEAPMLSQCRMFRSDLLLYANFRSLYLRLCRGRITQ